MRNRVALKAARMAAMTSKLVLVMVLIPVALAATAQSASADTVAGPAAGDVAVENTSVGILGPVGIAAVVLGFGGLIAGLLRHHRRRDAASAVAVQVEATQPMEPATGRRVA